MTRTGVLGFLFLAFVLVFTDAESHGWQVTDRLQADLREQLETGLRARRDIEFEFIAEVVRLVEQQQLPESMVLSTFQWARRQQRHPFLYFAKALQLRAREIGVEITVGENENRRPKRSPLFGFLDSLLRFFSAENSSIAG